MFQEVDKLKKKTKNTCFVATRRMSPTARPVSSVLRCDTGLLRVGKHDYFIITEKLFHAKPFCSVSGHTTQSIGTVRKEDETNRR